MEVDSLLLLPFVLFSLIVQVVILTTIVVSGIVLRVSMVGVQDGVRDLMVEVVGEGEGVGRVVVMDWVGGCGKILGGGLSNQEFL
ncbi:hypothetical protein RJT34_04581 [Clitoria ternatea]|uniref:Transmembrane protein n=1 Tax=Clitoria ternatea TaxID=43366 RepID=A0AAN9KPG7_CLITE